MTTLDMKVMYEMKVHTTWTGLRPEDFGPAGSYSYVYLGVFCILPCSLCLKKSYEVVELVHGLGEIGFHGWVRHGVRMEPTVQASGLPQNVCVVLP